MYRKNKIHSDEVRRLAEQVCNEQSGYRTMFVIDMNEWGVASPFSSPLNRTMYNDTLIGLMDDTYVCTKSFGVNDHGYWSWLNLN